MLEMKLTTGARNNNGQRTTDHGQAFMNLASIFGGRFWPLTLKELRQIKRNRRLVVSLIIPPTVQLLLFGFALNPAVQHLRLGVVDASRTMESRALTSAFVESQSFEVTGQFASVDEMGAALSRGDLD